MVKIYPESLPHGQYSRCYNNNNKKIVSLFLIITIGVVLTIVITVALSQCNIAYSCDSRNLSLIYLTTYRKFKY
jgi:hypothetical protein